MGRPKGSKNKATLLAESLKANMRDGVKAKDIAPQPEAPPPEPVVVERKEEYLPAWRLGAHQMELQREYYQSSLEIPERIWAKLDKVFTAGSLSEAELLAHKAVDSYNIHLLASWGKGLVPGPAGSVAAAKKTINSRRGLILLLGKKPGNEAKIAEYEQEIERLTKELEETVQPPPPWQTPRWSTIS